MKIKITPLGSGHRLTVMSNNRKDQTHYASTDTTVPVGMVDRQELTAVLDELFKQAVLRYGRVALPRGYTVIKEE